MQGVKKIISKDYGNAEPLKKFSIIGIIDQKIVK